MAAAASLLLITACSSDSKSASTSASKPASTAAPTSAPTSVSTSPAAASSTSTAVLATTSVPVSADVPQPPVTGGTVPTSADIGPVGTAATTTSAGGTANPAVPGTGGATSAFSVETASGVVSLKAKPVRIVSLAPTHTESLFAIGAGAQVIAVDDQSNYPAAAAAVKSSLSGFTPNVEAIAGYKPDLVVISDDGADHLAAQLQSLGIPVWIGPAATSLDDVYSEIEQLGTLTGNGDAASALITEMQGKIKASLAELPTNEVPITYYHELDNTYFSVTSKTFVGQLYTLAGLQNIADQSHASNDYPQLSSELIISANPRLIFLADTKCCGETAATVAARDGWSNIAAVKNNGVIAMDDDIASRWGPRVVDYMQAIVDAVKAIRPTSGG